MTELRAAATTTSQRSSAAEGLTALNHLRGRGQLLAVVVKIEKERGGSADPMEDLLLKKKPQAAAMERQQHREIGGENAPPPPPVHHHPKAPLSSSHGKNLGPAAAAAATKEKKRQRWMMLAERCKRAQSPGAASASSVASARSPKKLTQPTAVTTTCASESPVFAVAVAARPTSSSTLNRPYQQRQQQALTRVCSDDASLRRTAVVDAPSNKKKRRHSEEEEEESVSSSEKKKRALKRRQSECSDMLLPSATSRSCEREVVTETEPDLQELQEHCVYRAMMKLKPVQETESFKRAMKRCCPRGVISRDLLDRYLAYARGNERIAAKRLAKCWSLRLQVFGPKLCYRENKMLYTAAGDLEFIQSGAVVQLPNDAWGRAVVCIDCARFAAMQKGAVKLRVAWLYIQLLSDCSSDQVVLLFRCDDHRQRHHQGWQQQNVGELFEFAGRAMREAMNARVVAAHLLLGQQQDKNGSLLMLAAEWSQNVRKWFGHSLEIVDVHFEQPLARLESLYGLTRAGLPQTVGGQWSYERDWPAWVQQHLLLHHHQESLPPSAAAVPPLPQDPVVLKKFNESAARRVSSSSSTVTRAAATATAPETAVSSSSNPSPRPCPSWSSALPLNPDDTKSLASAPLAGAAGSPALSAPSRRQSAPKTDQDIVANVENMMEARRQMRRQQNLLYSQRKRAKEKATEGSLRQKIRRLERKQRLLKRDHEHLVQLMGQAQAEITARGLE